MYKKILSDFSAGINLACAPLQLGLDSAKTAWAQGMNVEIFSTKGVCRQNGNSLITTVPKNAAVTSLFTFTPGAMPSRRRILYTTASGDFCEFVPQSNTHNVLKSGLTSDKPCFYAEFLSGVAVCNGVDEPFYFKCGAQGASSEICEMKTIAKDGESPIIPTAMCAYKSRLWLAEGDTLYFSALGTYDDWDSADDAGFISNFHCDSTPVRALRPYKDYLAIYKPAQVYLLSGDSQDDFAIAPFADKGAAAQNAVVTAANRQFFFSNALFSLEQSGILAQITLGSEASLAIKPALNGSSDLLKSLKDAQGKTFSAGGALDKNRLDAVHVLSYEPKNQLWVYVPTENNPYLNNIWIYDIVHAAWTLRSLPQPVLCAANYGENIISGTQDGRILLEDTSMTFDGTPIVFEWKSPFLTLGNPNSRKLVDEFYFLISDTIDNNFLFRAYKDYDTLDAQDAEEIRVDNLQNLVWASDLHEGKQYLWAQEASGAGSADSSAAGAAAASDSSESSENADDSGSSETVLAASNTSVENVDESSSNTENADDESIYGSRWAIPCDIAQKAEISGSCLSVQFCISGEKAEHNFALLALEYKEITAD